ncbi:hypothetical protein ASPWEDRAFT_470368 [Aspergillus wentii DTO 134E9]|uniref:3-hydroxyisobutyrate dehydrogenase-like NAD-binding domain-containing protein n=1 Tax=Aspergillus wentii DTO 134E9 TaxID=1073089 RepID=A0A1L9RSJ8_ASPWE|nr:uncharacterized protein ASPWEDRAFT_470368 [Aspergillus wentii DTO 134E9]OJJ37787.1 hypothetical protein ASPWEDRAFT_470368 [Aspergillus wentii DTO 134E9]
MGREGGLDIYNLTELINSSTGRCWPMEVNNPVPGVVSSAPASNEYEPGCPVSMINKDLGLAMAGAAEAKISLLLPSRRGGATMRLTRTVCLGRDFSILYQWLQNRSFK